MMKLVGVAIGAFVGFQVGGFVGVTVLAADASDGSVSGKGIAGFGIAGLAGAIGGGYLGYRLTR